MRGKKETLKRIYIEIINRCNLRCSFCPPSCCPPRMMSTAEFERLAAAARNYTRYIYLHVKGEPLIHPQLEELLEIARQQDLRVNLTTNGLLLPQKAELLLRSAALRQTNLSVHGYTRETHGDLDEWMASLCHYARCSAAKGGYTVFRFWTLGADRQAQGDSAQAIRLLEREFPHCGSIAEQSEKRSMTLGKGIFVSFEEQFRWPDPRDPVLDTQGTCYGARAMIGILADGTVVPCCLDSEGACPLGNALEQPLSEILTSPRYLTMAGGFANQQVVESLCQRCEYRRSHLRKHNRNYNDIKEQERLL